MDKYNSRLIDDDTAMNVFMNDIWSYVFEQTRNMTNGQKEDCWSGSANRTIWNIRNAFLLPVMQQKPIQEMSVLNG